MANFLYIYLELNAGVTYLALASSETDRRTDLDFGQI